jgi:pimeloyl-ACP methyl ester carboxylesterase
MGRRQIVLLSCMLIAVGWASRPVVAAGIGSEAIRVEDSRFVPIGGIEQWISVRGAGRGNPVVLVVHGGPGESQEFAAAKYQPWERDFIVVQWDQRGAGRTFRRNGEQTPDVNLGRISRDGIEVAEYLCRTLDKKKIIVLGHSWGSTVAVHMVQLRPELFAAYVGTGQVASWKASVQTQFDVLLAKARADHDTTSLKELEAIGRPDPSDSRQYFQFTKGLGAVMAASDQQWLKTIRTSTPASLGVDEKDFEDLKAGMTFTGPRVLPDQMATDLFTTAADILVPFFVIQGRGDVMTPTTAAVAYFNQVKAPVKALILIEGAGHFAFMTHPGEFLAALTDKVRPVAVSRGA